MAKKAAPRAPAPMCDIAASMTYRQWLAGQAMAGLLAHPKCGDVGLDEPTRTRFVALEAIACADALIAELKKESR